MKKVKWLPVFLLVCLVMNICAIHESRAIEVSQEPEWEIINPYEEVDWRNQVPIKDLSSVMGECEELLYSEDMLQVLNFESVPDEFDFVEFKELNQVRNFVESVNNTPSLNAIEILHNKDDYEENLRLAWDAVLTETMPLRQVFGFAHNTEDDLVDTYNVMMISENTEENIRKAVNSGAFYTVSQFLGGEEFVPQNAAAPFPKITDVVVRNTKNEHFIKIKGGVFKEVIWIADGEVITSTYSHYGYLELDKFDSDISYVRAVIIGWNGIAYTQPFPIKSGKQDAGIKDILFTVDKEVLSTDVDAPDNYAQITLEATDFEGNPYDLSDAEIKYLIVNRSGGAPGVPFVGTLVISDDGKIRPRKAFDYPVSEDIYALLTIGDYTMVSKTIRVWAIPKGYIGTTFTKVALKSAIEQPEGNKVAFVINTEDIFKMKSAMIEVSYDTTKLRLDKVTSPEFQEIEIAVKEEDGHLFIDTSHADPLSYKEDVIYLELVFECLNDKMTMETVCLFLEEMLIEEEHCPFWSCRPHFKSQEATIFFKNKELVIPEGKYNYKNVFSWLKFTEEDFGEYFIYLLKSDEGLTEAEINTIINYLLENYPDNNVIFEQEKRKILLDGIDGLVRYGYLYKNSDGSYSPNQAAIDKDYEQLVRHIINYIGNYLEEIGW